MLTPLKPRIGRWFFAAGVAIAGVVAGWELLLQVQENRFVRSVSLSVIEGAGAASPLEKAVALRDYLRKEVTSLGAPNNDRPFLRATAAETLQSGRGYCGEVSRAFICMANSLGMRAQRINLVGNKIHTVAEIEVSPSERWIVDCQNPPSLVRLATIDELLRGPDYTDYFTVNLRRLQVNWLISRIKLQHGPWDYVLERPHLLKAIGWGGLVASLFSLMTLRWLVRRILTASGWVHVSTITKSAVPDLPIRQDQAKPLSNVRAGCESDMAESSAPRETPNKPTGNQSTAPK